MYYPTGSSHSIIPAAPDWALASFDTGTEGLIFQPVIAWFLVTRVGEYSARATHEPKVEKLVSVEVIANLFTGANRLVKAKAHA